MTERTIGQKLKTARLRLDLSLEQASIETKIRKEILSKIEENDFSNFDSHVYAKGFIRNYAKYLKVDSEQLLGIYRRDYEFKTNKRGENKKTEEKEKKALKKQNQEKKDNFELSSKQIALVIVLIFVLTLGFLTFRFISKTFRKPELKITAPIQLEAGFNDILEYDQKSIQLVGETEDNTKVYINEEPINLKPGNIFETEPIPLLSERNIIEIVARSRLGINSVIKIEIPKSVQATNLFEGIDSIITIKNDTTFVLVRADGIIKYNDQAFPNDAFNIKAERSIEIETSKPENIVVLIDNKEYKLSKAIEVFEHSNGMTTQR